MKKKHKRGLVILSVMALPLLLAGCGTSNVTAHSTGIWDHYVIWNFIRAIEWLSHLFGNNYGWGIIVFTVIVRIIILPLMFYQNKSMRKTTELQPQFKALQTKYPDARTDPDQARAMQEEQQKLYADAGISPVAGCLPMLVQMPVLIALYQAIFRSPVLKSGHFFWMELGDKDPYYIMPILAALFTFLTSYLSMMSQPEQNGMTKIMTYGMSIMTFIMAINFPAALSLYWMITNAFSVGQILLISNPFKIRREREEQERQAKEAQRKKRKARQKALKNRKKG